jgi:hypothetical protein
LNDPATKKSRVDVLREEGWTRQFVAEEPRLSEAAAMYREAGFEVHLEPLSSEPVEAVCVGKKSGSGCRTCFEGFEERYKIIFTRPPKKRRQGDTTT